MVRMDWFISNFLGGVKLQVRPEDVPEQPIFWTSLLEKAWRWRESGPYHQPQCPACDSLDVSFEELNKPVAYTSAYIGFPLPLHRSAWRCHACGHEWEEAGRMR